VSTPPRPAPRRFKWLRRLGVAALGLVVAATCAHYAVGCATRLSPPLVERAPGAVAKDGAIRRFGPGYATKRGDILEVRLAGSPEAIGTQMGALLRDEMIAIEGELFDQFRTYVPLPPVRALMVDLAKLQFRDADLGMSEARRRELAAQSLSFSPDPFDDVMPTYDRFVYLSSLYDVSLSFEHSPLLGCTSFVARGDASEAGRVLLARNFDFEAGASFDRGKAVFLVFEEGRIPYASVSWPGFVGAFSGMNREGLALVVHGGRARDVVPGGEPVPHTMREVLARAKTVDEAIAILAERKPMVSHIVLVADRSGDAAAVERAPGVLPHARRGSPVLAVTNHFEGPLADDPKNHAIRARTSTLARRARLDELLAKRAAPIDVRGAIDVLRDKKGTGDEALTLGDRRTLDALIATHAIVADATDARLWVSEGPHLTGRFIAFDLAKLLDLAHDPGDDEPLVTAPVDPILEDGRYDAWERAGSPHGGEPAAER
jgi:isopenicillin-N N-acyltransferase-like protein